jgi:hypothetical protein
MENERLANAVIIEKGTYIQVFLKNSPTERAAKKHIYIYILGNLHLLVQN